MCKLFLMHSSICLHLETKYIDFAVPVNEKIFIGLTIIKDK